MNFSLKNYSCKLFSFIGTFGKVELISTFTQLSANARMKVTNKLGIMLEIINNCSSTRLAVRIIGVIKRQYFHLVTHVLKIAITHKRLLQSTTGEI